MYDLLFIKQAFLLCCVRMPNKFEILKYRVHRLSYDQILVESRICQFVSAGTICLLLLYLFRKYNIKISHYLRQYHSHYTMMWPEVTTNCMKLIHTSLMPSKCITFVQSCVKIHQLVQKGHRISIVSKNVSSHNFRL
jgi:hypothetical protein